MLFRSQSSDVDYRSLNVGKGAMNITNLDVNEASPYAIFKITNDPSGALADRVLTLSLGQDTDPTSLDAINGVDYKSSFEWSLDGKSWKGYIFGTQQPTLKSSASSAVYVRVAINNDTPPNYEGPEVFRLTATDPSGLVASGGFGTIYDDGTGDVWLSTATSDAPSDPSAVGYPSVLDNDVPIDITNTVNNEGSPYALFTLSGVPGDLVTLKLQATGTSPAVAPSDYAAAFEYLDPSSNLWKTYDPSGSGVNLDDSGSLLVRVDIKNDTPAVYEGPETYTLVATRKTPDASGNLASIVSTGGQGTIIDNGTGTWVEFDACGNPVIDPSGITLDDDTPLQVSNLEIGRAHV